MRRTICAMLWVPTSLNDMDRQGIASLKPTAIPGSSYHLTLLILYFLADGRKRVELTA